MAKILMNDAQLNRVSAAVTAAEKTTTGEIVPVVVRKSDTYPGARWRIAVTFSMLCAFALYWALPHHDPIWYLLVQLPALGLGYGFGAAEQVLRLALAPAVVQSEVHQRALQSFLTTSLHETRERTGILIFVSVLERRVEILADTGIHAKVPPGTWDQVVDRMVLRIREQSLEQALIGAIEECGSILSERFPARAGDNPNELSDLVRIEQD